MHQFASLMGQTALATKEFKIDPNAPDGCLVRIVGRKSGLVDWFFSLVGIDTTTVFEVYRDHIKLTASNLSGQLTTVLPISAISSTTSGFFKPILYLVIGVMLLPVFLIGLIPIIYFFLNKSLLVSVQSHSSASTAIAFKRSVIEGVKVDKEQADQVVALINSLVLQAQKRTRRDTVL